MTPDEQPFGERFAAPDDATRREIADAVGAAGLVDEADAAPYLTEWRGRWPGAASMIVAPRSTQEVAKVVEICARRRIAVTPQGGNTGLVGGQIPFGPEVLLSLKRMRTIRALEPKNNSMTVEAGLTLLEAQRAAEEAGRFFPLSIGAEGSSQIGGVLSTNAGGVNVLRYGNARDLTLGLEVVAADGRIWNGLKRLRKDNTGYNLKHLFIGGEGTLGVITAAVLKLFPAPAARIVALAGLASPARAVDLLELAQDRTGGAATSFELIARLCVELTQKHIAGVRDPLDAAHHWYVLMEFSGGDAGSLKPAVEDALGNAIEKGVVDDAVIASSGAQAEALWRMRHSISEALNGEGLGARHDVSVATADIPAFLERADKGVEAIAPGARVAAFGHIGDGNVHYDIVGPEGAPATALDDKREAIEAAIYDIIEAFDGSISAEHGVGRHRRAAIAERKSEVELDMMRAVKRALDPHGIMNPGKML